MPSQVTIAQQSSTFPSGNMSSMISQQTFRQYHQFRTPYSGNNLSSGTDQVLESTFDTPTPTSCRKPIQAIGPAGDFLSSESEVHHQYTIPTDNMSQNPSSSSSMAPGTSDQPTQYSELPLAKTEWCLQRINPSKKLNAAQRLQKQRGRNLIAARMFRIRKKNECETLQKNYRDQIEMNKVLQAQLNEALIAKTQVSVEFAEHLGCCVDASSQQTLEREEGRSQRDSITGPLRNEQGGTTPSSPEGLASTNSTLDEQASLHRRQRRIDSESPPMVLERLQCGNTSPLDLPLLQPINHEQDYYSHRLTLNVPDGSTDSYWQPTPHIESRHAPMHISFQDLPQYNYLRCQSPPGCPLPTPLMNVGMFQVPPALGGQQSSFSMLTTAANEYHTASNLESNREWPWQQRLP